MIYRRKSFFEYLRTTTWAEWLAGALIVASPYILIWAYYLFTGKPVQF